MQKTHYSSFSITSNSIDNSQNNASLKGKISALESLMYEVADSVEIHRKEYQSLKQLKDEFEAILSNKTEDMLKTLQNELIHLDDEMKREVGYQLAENSRIQTQLTHLKGEKTALAIKLNELHLRIGNLEVQVGNHEQN
ncbi:unnamed protein product (macronuclear) [Paramecium tetraurelia]|uniref:Uncharacterized protein n=1 Tax=Paramecium tetraurelia TaxID=5888 RepID=A0DU07_PARTE|nr:uncharacterized protein GSPATT00020208001 [Paramecium tetraurelia]CAK86524.1 unnamed protein product [Paramecium tetraurelia]|eukprot:XP_001453921.1 hypothetical protein (macronuclear) [Paramecium tetraurelia strain d4-2]